MVAPGILAGIEQTHQGARLGDGRDICALVSIADHTGIRQVTFDRLAPMLFTDNVIDFVRKARVVLVDQTVFTA